MIRNFSGNPTLYYRSHDPLQVIGEVTHWQGRAAAKLQQMQSSVAQLKAQGAAIID